MPQTIIMQGLSTAFATLMTVTVISFPTPRDLLDTVFPPSTGGETVEIVSGGMEPKLPGQIEDMTPGEITEQLDACADSLSAAIPFGIDTCRNTIMVSGLFVSKHPGEQEVADKLELATALYCRVEWVNAAAESHGFDRKACEGLALALAN